MVFMDRLVNANFSSELAIIPCTIGFGHTRQPYNCECFPVNYSSFLQLQNFSTSNDLHYTVVLRYICTTYSYVIDHTVLQWSKVTACSE